MPYLLQHISSGLGKWLPNICHSVGSRAFDKAQQDRLDASQGYSTSLVLIHCCIYRASTNHQCSQCMSSGSPVFRKSP